MKYIKNLIVVFLTVVVGVILSLFTKENFYVYLTYLMVIYNTVITLSMVDDLEELKEYFANYKNVNRLQQIDKCKDDIERYKKWILEREEELKKLEEEEN